ncbi:beta strand repeat-containing protein [Maribacter thermophilus]|uniref:beta strand repeat-containing protein n=1 Tax=Maribacter thermophilus TaxID=1197874 RepID=UPI0012F7490E|nr:hypothetical protein [Maribacter thermophilus]
MRSQIITAKSSALKKILVIFTLLLSGMAFAQTTVTLEDQCNCEVLQGTDVSAPGVTSPTGADLGDLYVNTTTGTIYFWDGDSWELTAIDLNTTNTSFTIDSAAGDLVITDSDANEVRVPLADIAAEVNTNTTNVTFEVNTTTGTLDIIDSDTNVVSVPLADIAAEVNTDDQNATEVSLLNPIDVDGDSTNETTVEEAIADLAANNALDLDIDPTNELTTSGNGAPVGAPANDNPGATYLDTSTNELYVYDGTNWTMVTDNQNASEVSFDNTGTTLTAGNVQDALSELDGNITSSELTTTVVAGAGNNVTSVVSGNNTEYTVSSQISGDAGNNISLGTDNGLFSTDDQNATEVGLLNPIDVDGDSTNETTVEEAIADLAANNALDLDIDPTNELTTSGNGAPVGAPANDNPGVTYLDTSTNELYVYDGTNWNMVTDNQNLSEVLADGNDGGGLAITNIANPSNAQDAATKAYVDGEIAAATTLNDGQIYVGDASNNAVGVTASGDATISNTGVIDLTADAVETDEIIDGAVTSDKILDGTITTVDIANDAVSLEKLAHGTADGQVMRWDAATSSWTLVDLGSVTVTENDGVIGNEVVGPSNGSLVLSGTGTTVDPLRLAVAENGITTDEIAAGAVESSDIAAGAVNAATINNDVAGSGLIKNGTTGALDVDVSALSGDGSITSPNSTITLGGNPANSIFEDVTLDVDVSALTGDGDITSSDLTVGGDSNALLGDVSLEIAAGAVGNTELGADAVTSDKILDGTIASDDIAAGAVNAATINNDVAGSGLIKNGTTGALDVDVSALSGDGSITSPNSTITLGGTPANSIFEDVTLDVDVSALTGDGDITSSDLTVGGDSNALLGDVTLEITAGAVGTTELAADAVDNTKLADNAVNTENITDGTITASDIADDAITAAAINSDVAGTGLVQNATTGALEVDGTAITGDGDITSSDLTVGGDSNALLGDVTLEIAAGAVGNTELGADAVTSDKILDGTIASGDIGAGAVNAATINNDVAGSGLTQNATTGALEVNESVLADGSLTSPNSTITLGGTPANSIFEDVTLDVDVSALTGDGDITSSDLTVGGDSNALLGDVTLEIAAGAVGNTELGADAVTSDKILDGTITTVDIANDAVSLEKLANGTADGQVMQWDDTTSSWTLVDLGSVTVTENDGVIGNEVTGATDGTLTVSGAGTTVSPLTLGITTGGVSTTQLANGGVTLDKLADGTTSGNLIQWNGTDWEYVAASTLIPATTVSNTSSVNTLTTTVNGVTGAGVAIINSNTLSINGSNELVSTVNGVVSNNVSLSPYLDNTDDQDADEVAFDDSSASLGATDVQGAIEALASAPDNDTQYTAGDGLNLDASNEFTVVADPAANNALSIGANGLYATDTDDQDADEVAFDDSSASLGATDVQGAIEALASAPDNDTQYTAGDGLNLDASNEFTVVADPAANNALSIGANGLYATDTDDQDADEVAFDDSSASLGATDVQGAIEALASAPDNDTQYTAGDGLNLDASNEFTAVASPDANNALEVRGNGLYATDTDDQDADEVAFDDSSASLGATDVQGAIEALASAPDNDTQYTAGDGLNLDASNEFTVVADPAANNALSVGANGLYATDTDDQDADEVAFDDSSASLGATDVQGAIEALASAPDNDTQYTAGDGLNLDASNEFTVVADPAANNALSVSANGLYATDTDDQDASEVNLSSPIDVDGDSVNETNVQEALEDLAANSSDDQNIANLSINTSSNVLTVGIENGSSQTVDLSHLDNPGTDNQNIANLAFSGTTLTVGIENGSSQTVSLLPLADNQSIQGSNLSGTTLTIGIEDGSSETVDLSSLANTDNQQISLSGNTITLSNGTGTDTSVTLPTADGTETIVTAGNDISVTGDGSASTPYVINNVRPDIFYPPSIEVDVATVGTGRSIDLHAEYVSQYGSPMVRSDVGGANEAPAAIPTYAANELYYYVTYYDATVFANVQVNANGIMTYDVIATPTDYNTLINVVFVAK